MTKNGRDYASSKKFSTHTSDTTLSLNTLMDLDVFDMIRKVFIRFTVVFTDFLMDPIDLLSDGLKPLV